MPKPEQYALKLNRLFWVGVVLSATLGVGMVMGYWLNSLVRWFNEGGRPAIHVDVADSVLKWYGVPFARPAGARNVVAVAVGNGVGDVTTYTAMDLPEGEARNILASLKSTAKLRAASEWPEPVYLDQLQPELAKRLWPAAGTPKAEFYHYDYGEIAYVPGASLHIYSTFRIK